MGIIVPSRRVIAPKISEFEIDWSSPFARGLYFFANLGAACGSPAGFEGSRTSFTFGSSLSQLQGYGRFSNHVIKLDKSVPAGGLASVLCKFKGYTGGNNRLVDCDYDSGVYLACGSGTVSGGFSVASSPYGQTASIDHSVPNVLGLVRTGTTASMSINGVEVSTQSNPNAWTSGNRIAIGGTSSGASERIVADIEWVALWTRPLSAAETLVFSRDPYGSLLKRKQARRTYFNSPSGSTQAAGASSIVVAPTSTLRQRIQISGPVSPAVAATGALWQRVQASGAISIDAVSTGGARFRQQLVGDSPITFSITTNLGYVAPVARPKKKDSGFKVHMGPTMLFGGRV